MEQQKGLMEKWSNSQEKEFEVLENEISKEETILKLDKEVDLNEGSELKQDDVDKEKTEELQRTKCEVWSRVVGYLRPTKNWNEGKQAEWDDRKVFEVC